MIFEDFGGSCGGDDASNTAPSRVLFPYLVFKLLLRYSLLPRCCDEELASIMFVDFLFCHEDVIESFLWNLAFALLMLSSVIIVSVTGICWVTAISCSFVNSPLHSFISISPIPSLVAPFLRARLSTSAFVEHITNLNHAQIVVYFVVGET